MPDARWSVSKDALEVTGTCGDFTLCARYAGFREPRHVSEIYVIDRAGDELVSIDLRHQKTPDDGAEFTYEAIEVACALMWSATRRRRVSGQEVSHG